MFKRLTQWAEGWLNSKWMMPSLGVASFLESIIVPIPLEAILVPLMQKRRELLWWLALVALVGCIAGAVVGYYVGYAFMETAGQWLVEKVGQQDAMQRAEQAMQENGFWFVMSVSVVPVPFQIAMLAAGATKYSLPLFMLATVISRGIRYFGLAALVYYFGDAAERVIAKHKVATVVGICVVVAGFWAWSLWK